MSKRIKNLEDLKAVSSTAAAELSDKKPTKYIKKTKQKSVKKRVSSKIVVPAKSFNIEETLSEIKNRPNPIQGYVRHMSTKQLEKEIAALPGRIDRINTTYQTGIDRGEDNYGYRLVALFYERELDQLVRRLNQKQENT